MCLIVFAVEAGLIKKIIIGIVLVLALVAGIAVFNASQFGKEPVVIERVEGGLYAGAGHVEFILGATQNANNHFRMFFFLSGLRAILTITGNIEYRPHLILLYECFVNELFASREMLARGQNRERFLAFKKRVIRMWFIHVEVYTFEFCRLRFSVNRI